MTEPTAVAAAPITGAESPYIEGDLRFAAESSVPVLISGSRAAATWIAAWLHRRTFGDGKPFVEIECHGDDNDVAIAIESLIQAVSSGTILLHDIEALSPRLQRVVGESLAGSAWRIVSSTSTDLYGLCQLNAFDEHTFYRLNILHITAGSAEQTH